MPFVVTENCIKCKHTDCVEVCPVDCFHEGPNFLVIDPDECIDCTLCEPECPVSAIFPEEDVPAGQEAFAALNVATGEVLARTKEQHRAKDFVAFLRVIDKHVDDGLEVHVILDNLSAHKAPEVQRWLVRHPRFHLHFTPTYSSWLNLVERFFGLLTEQALKRGVKRFGQRTLRIHGQNKA